MSAAAGPSAAAAAGATSRAEGKRLRKLQDAMRSALDACDESLTVDTVAQAFPTAAAEHGEIVKALISDIFGQLRTNIEKEFAEICADGQPNVAEFLARIDMEVARQSRINTGPARGQRRPRPADEPASRVLRKVFIEAKRQEVVRLRAALAKLEAENGGLEAEVTALDEEAQGLAEEARTHVAAAEKTEGIAASAVASVKPGGAGVPEDVAEGADDDDDDDDDE